MTDVMTWLAFLSLFCLFHLQAILLFSVNLKANKSIRCDGIFTHPMFVSSDDGHLCNERPLC